MRVLVSLLALGLPYRTKCRLCSGEAEYRGSPGQALARRRPEGHPRLLCASLQHDVSRSPQRLGAGEVELVAVMIRSPADRERKRPTCRRKGVRLSSKEPGGRSLAPPLD